MLFGEVCLEVPINVEERGRIELAEINFDIVTRATGVKTDHGRSGSNRVFRFKGTLQQIMQFTVQLANLTDSGERGLYPD